MNERTRDDDYQQQQQQQRMIHTKVTKTERRKEWKNPTNATRRWRRRKRRLYTHCDTHILSRNLNGIRAKTQIVCLLCFILNTPLNAYSMSTYFYCLCVSIQIYFQFVFYFCCDFHIGIIPKCSIYFVQF